MSSEKVATITSGQRSLRSYRYYDTMVHVFVVVLLISNLAGGKITALGPINLFGYFKDVLHI